MQTPPPRQPPRRAAGGAASAPTRTATANTPAAGAGDRSNGAGGTANAMAPASVPNSKMTAYTPAARRSARTRALAEARSVLTSPGYAADLTDTGEGTAGGGGEGGRAYLDGFNLTAVVSNPRYGAGGDIYHARSPAGSKHGDAAAASAADAASPGASADAASANPPSPANTSNMAAANMNTATSALSAATGLSLSALAPLHELEEDITEGLHDLSATINTVNSYVSTLSAYYLGSSIIPIPGTDDDRAHLEYDGGLAPGEALEAQLAPEELREELRSVELATVEAYLRKCGGLAWRFDSRRGESECVNVGDGDGHGATSSGNAGSAAASPSAARGSTDNDDGGGSSNNLGQDMDMEAGAEEEEEQRDPTDDVPDIYFSPYFDLTDPHTFESLLVMDQDEISGNGNGSDIDGSGGTSVTPSLMAIHPTESLSANLDVIELALLNQVRSKSSSFFRETNRFSYLQHQVAECVAEVQSLRSGLGNIKERTVTDVELIPIMDRKRGELRLLAAVLDEVQDVVEVKGSVAGLIAAGDYVGAVAAIRNARTLLRGDRKKRRKKGRHRDDGATDDQNDGDEAKADEKLEEEEEDHDNDVANMTPTERAEKEAAEAALDFPLSRLAAMSKVDDQLNQYEELVVNDLATELVETFLSWENGSSSSSTSTTSLLSSSSPFSLGGGVGRRSRTREIVHALTLCQKRGFAADLYKTKLSDVVRVTVRTTVTECAADALAELERMKNSKKISATATEGGGDKPTQGKSSVTAGVTSMTFDQFLSCLDMLFDQILTLLKGAVGVTKFLREEGIVLKDEDPAAGDDGDAATKSSGGTGKPTATALTAAADLSHKSVSELLRLRKESHSLISFNEMKRLWDTCLSFTLSIEKLSGQKAYGLRSTLLTQAKAFVERRHEANMASLVSALDGERWSQCDVSSERQTALDRLCSGRAVLSGQGTIDVITGAPSSTGATAARPEGTKLAEADVEGKRYKVVWSCLLLVEMVMSNVACAAHFQTLATNVVGKVCELLRLFNSRTTQLVLGAGAIHSAARLKSINAKHLSLVTQCLGLVVTILPHVRAALMAQLPAKQHNLLLELDKIKKEYGEHNEKVLAKLVSIIGGIIERGLAPRIAKTDFDARAKSMPTPSLQEVKNLDYKNSVTCCQFLDGISVNARKMHQVLVTLLPPEDLIDVFSRIFAYVDTKVPALFLAAVAEGEKQTVVAAKAAAEAASQKAQQGGTVVALPPQPGPAFRMPKTDEGKLRMILEVDSMSKALNRLPNVQPWDFTAFRVLQRELDVNFGLNSGTSAGATDAAMDDLSPAEDSQVEEQKPIEDEAAVANGIDSIDPTTLSSQDDMSAMHGLMQTIRSDPNYITGASSDDGPLPTSDGNDTQTADQLNPTDTDTINRETSLPEDDGNGAVANDLADASASINPDPSKDITFSAATDGAKPIATATDDLPATIPSSDTTEDGQEESDA